MLLKFLRNHWDRASAVAAFIAGGVALLLGWLGISDTVYPAEQLPYVISGGCVGLFVLGLGVTQWLSSDLRDEWRQLQDIKELLRSDASTDHAPITEDGRPVKEMIATPPQRWARTS
jgi:hypothetical protein